MVIKEGQTWKSNSKLAQKPFLIEQVGSRFIQVRWLGTLSREIYMLERFFKLILVFKFHLVDEGGSHGMVN